MSDVENVSGNVELNGPTASKVDYRGPRPRWAYQPRHSVSLDKFKDTLEFDSTFDPQCPDRHQGRPIYKHVMVLALGWHADLNSKQMEASDQLCQIFQDSYRYRIERCRMSRKLKITELKKRFTEYFKGTGEDSLVIIHYIGGARKMYHKSWSGPATRLVPLDGNGRGLSSMCLEEIVIGIRCPVLMLMDCRFREVMSIKNNREILAPPAYIDDDKVWEEMWSLGAFTRSIARQLRDAVQHKHVLTTSQLYAQIAGYVATTSGAVPFHARGDEQESQLPIYLAPLDTDLKGEWTTPPRLPLPKQSLSALLYAHVEDSGGCKQVTDSINQWVDSKRLSDQIYIRNFTPINGSMVYDGP